MYRIMLVDDEEGIVRALRRVLSSANHEVETFTSVAEALTRANTAPFDLIISDYRMPEMDGVSFLTAVKEMRPESMRMILSAYTDKDALMGAINRAQIFRFINKPWDDDELLAIVEQALEYYTVLKENRVLADRVREQQTQLDRQRLILETLEEESPGITRVKWGSDGSIMLEESDL